MNKISKISIIVILCMIAPVMADIDVEKTDNRTFLLEANSLFRKKLHSYQRLLERSNHNESIGNRIEKLIEDDINNFDEWAILHYNEVALPNGNKEVSKLAAGEHSAAIKSILDEMRIAMMGVHNKKIISPTMIQNIDAVINISYKLDKNLKGMLLFWESLERPTKKPDIE
jgi:hypothetical protein